MTNNQKINELFAAGCHLGHKDNRVHPKSRKYIYSVENGVSIIDLTKTAPMLESAKKFIISLAKENKTILAVATKRISTELLTEMCRDNDVPFVSLKWPAGLLTNFDMLSKNIKKMETMRTELKNGDWSKFVKHEQVKLQKELNKLEKFYGPFGTLNKLPSALFIIDIKKEKNAVKEAVEMKIPVVAVVDTNVDPDMIEHPIPGNDDSLTSIQYFAKEIIETYAKNRPKAEVKKEAPVTKSK